MARVLTARSLYRPTGQRFRISLPCWFRTFCLFWTPSRCVGAFVLLSRVRRSRLECATWSVHPFFVVPCLSSGDVRAIPARGMRSGCAVSDRAVRESCFRSATADRRRGFGARWRVRHATSFLISGPANDGLIHPALRLAATMNLISPYASGAAMSTAIGCAVETRESLIFWRSVCTLRAARTCRRRSLPCPPIRWSSSCSCCPSSPSWRPSGLRLTP